MNLQSKNKPKHRFQASIPNHRHKPLHARGSKDKLTTVVHQSGSSKCYSSQLDRHIRDLEARVHQQSKSLPKAELHWLGSIEQILELVSSQPIPTTSMTALLALLEQIKQHQQVIVLDFGWSRFVVFMVSQHWGFIPNLHPNNSWQLQVQALQKLFGLVQGLQSVAKSGSRDSKRLLVLQSTLEEALLSGDQFRKQVRAAMFVALKSVCSD